MAGGSTYSPAQQAMFATRLIVNQRIMTYFAAGLSGIIALFVFFHWTRMLCVRLERSNQPLGAFGRPFVATTRLVRNVLVRRVPGFTSAGHGLVVSAYVAINLACLFTSLDITVPAVGNRLGWLSFGNLSLVVFLALKNTPLAFLTAYSYERLNCLHQIAGYTLFVQMVLHAAFYTSFFNSQGRLWSTFAKPEMTAAIIAGFSFLSIVVSATFIRRIRYELFYVIHIASAIAAIVTVGLHQPLFSKPLVFISIAVASMWGLDRLIRGLRVLYYSANNEATLHPLPNGGTKIVMKKVPARSEPGKHCFVWIPAIRKFETHPFTIHRGSPVEFTVKAHNGFTHDLHKYAVANPGVAVKASIDGPYGTFPDPMSFDKIVLIAGGGGATFTFGLAVNILERMNEETKKKVVFIWAVKKHENLSWFKEQLDVLRTHDHSPNVNVSLWVTRAPSSTSDLPSGEQSDSRSSDSEGADSTPTSPVDVELEKSTTAPRPPRPAYHLRHPRVLPADGDLEKEMGLAIETRVEDAAGKDKETLLTTQSTSTTATARHHYHPVKSGRPDVASLIREAVESTPSNQRVLVAACGPDGLMRIVRGTTAKLIRGDGPAVELHCEQFGW